jgi:tetratricopeptide (TPR) repeat protein
LGRLNEGWRLAWEKIPFFTLSAAGCVVTYCVQEHSGAVRSLQDFPISSRVGTALICYVRYMGMMLWPRHLAGLYLIGSGSWPWREVAGAAVVLLALSGLVLAQWRRRPWLAMGWFWYLVTLVPVIGLVQVGSQLVADRYTYVPLIGLFVMLVWGGSEWARARPQPSLGPATASVALAVCAVLTVHQEFYLKDSEAYFKRMIDVAPNNYFARYKLGHLYSQQKKNAEAISNLLAAIEGNPHFAEAFYDLGNVDLREGKTNEAILNWMAAVQEKPDFAAAQHNLGTLLLLQRRYEEALEHFRAAVRTHPEFADFFGLANALAEAAHARQDTHALAEAARTYWQALQLNAQSSDAHNNLGLVLQARGRLSEAVAQWERAVRLDSNRVDTWSQLGLAYAGQNRMAEAEGAFRQLVRLQPGSGDACCWLGSALAAQNKVAEAIPFYLQALKINPADWRSEVNLSYAYLEQGKREEAAEHYRRALQINPNLPEARKLQQALEGVAEPAHGGH